MDPFATCLTETEAKGGASWWHRAGRAGLRETELTSVESRPSLCRAVRWRSVGMANGAGGPGQGVTLGPGCDPGPREGCTGLPSACCV